MSYPRRDSKFILDSDASHNCLGGVLSQVQDGTERVIAYASKKMTKTQINYCVTRKELLAVHTFVTMFKHYLLGKKFLIRTDHKALGWMMGWKKPNTSQYCNWIAELEVFDFDIEHRAGKLHTNADFLSRLQECEQCELKHENPKKKRNVKYLDNNLNIRMLQETTSEDDVREILLQFHDALGHIGVNKMTRLIKESYNWKNMDQDIRKYVNNCIFCSKRKITKKKNVGDLHITASRPLEKIMVDIAGPLPPSKYGHKYIIGIVDVFSRFIMLIPAKNTESKYIIDSLLKHWVAIFGAPKMIISDGGSNLNSKIMSSFCAKFNVTKKTTCPYHPQSNGIIERSFRTIKDMVYASCKSSGKDWVDVLPHIEIGLRASFNKTTGYSPYEVLFGAKMPLPQTKVNDATGGHVKEHFGRICSIKKVIREAIKKKQDVNCISLVTPQFKVGDLVLVRKFRPMKENMLQAKYFGPCTVTEILGPKSYRVRYQDRVFMRSGDHLKKYYSTDENVCNRQGPSQKEGEGRLGAAAYYAERRYPMRRTRPVDRFEFYVKDSC